MASHSPVAIVTGAAQGIGYAISDRLLQEGFLVCLADINEDKAKQSLAELRKKYGENKLMYVKCDVTSKANFEEVFLKTQNEFGKIDVLVNNAGILDENTPERMVAINLMGTLTGCQLAFKFIGTNNGGKGGVVVNVASIAGLMTHPSNPVYCATKHGIVGLTRSYGDQYHLDSSGVIFMAVCPLGIRTQMLETWMTMNPESISGSITAGPELVAEGVMKLLGDKHNGSTLLVAPPGKLTYVDVPDELKKMSF